MSLENATTGKPSQYQIGEGCHAASSNRQVGAVESGGVSGGNTTGRGSKLRADLRVRGNRAGFTEHCQSRMGAVSALSVSRNRTLNLLSPKPDADAEKGNAERGGILFRFRDNFYNAIRNMVSTAIVPLTTKVWVE